MLNFFKHLLVPHSGNNHRAKILHNSSLLVLILFLLSFTFVAHLVNVNHPEVLGVSYSISDQELLTLVNQQRQQNGLSALTMNDQLSDAARRKAADMFAKNYWAHFAPDGSTSPWGFIRAAGYDYQYAGENLAKGFTDSGSVVTAWMNSPTHRDNILSNKYKDIGFAIVPGTLQGEDTVLVVQMFGSKPNEVAVVPQVPARVADNSPPQTTPIPTISPEVKKIVPVVAQESNSNPPAVNGSAVVNNPTINSKVASKDIVGVILIFILAGLMLDALIVERKKIPRVVGHNLDHIMIILLFILFIVILKGGVTL
ncbi:MAG TPA: CAP domain-containing protein [Patescibacteria group bacterium]|nr:CAP domain-containing protein [Patescibacteria group bacterium]